MALQTYRSSVVMDGKNISDLNHEINFFQYNVLSPNLSAPGWYAKSPPEALNKKVRLEKIFEKLQEQCQRHAIIALQEIPLQWVGKFNLFFYNNDYYCTSTQYGSAYSGYMGVLLAYPRQDFELQDSAIVVPAKKISFLEKKRKKKVKEEQIAKEASLTCKLLKIYFGLVSFLPLRPLLEPIARFAAVKIGVIADTQKTNKSKAPYQNVSERWNRAIFFKLKHVATEQSFSVGCYHQPCCFWDSDVMTMHSALVVEALDEFAGGDNARVLLGDFNIKPGDPAYNLITTGDLKDEQLTSVQKRIYPDWKPNIVSPLISAYCAAANIEGAEGEPKFTNHTFSGKKFFTGTLDYIFMSSHFQVTDVIETPDLTDDTPICPNHDEPSDHIAIGATLILSNENL